MIKPVEVEVVDMEVMEHLQFIHLVAEEADMDEVPMAIQMAVVEVIIPEPLDVMLQGMETMHMVENMVRMEDLV